MPRLWATQTDRQRLADARAAVFLVGSYDGSGNYGDVLQLAAVLRTVARLSGSPLAVPVIERETLGHHRALAQRHPGMFDGAAFAFFEGDGVSHEDDLVELRLTAPGPTALVYVYGGGFLNGWWGARKTGHVAAVEELTGGRHLPVVASGQQVDEATIAPGGPGHELLARASWIGVRDVGSLEYVREQIPGGAHRAELAGDDALPFLERPQTEASEVVNLHVNDGSWISDRPEAMRENVVSLVRELGLANGEQLELQPVVAYEDPRVSEREIVSDLLERQRGRLEKAGLRPTEPLDILDDAISNDLTTFRRARLTVSCSYHVALTSLLAGIPAVLLAQNDYYAQKAAGLRDLFRLGPTRVGVAGTPDDAPAAIEALLDGRGRSELVAHLRAQSRRVAARYEGGRMALSAALAEGLSAAW